MSSTNSTALGPVESIAISGRRASGTPSNPKMARPRTLGRSTKESSASTVTPRVPSDPQNKCARLTRSKVPGVDARSCASRMSRLYPSTWRRIFGIRRSISSAMGRIISATRRVSSFTNGSFSLDPSANRMRVPSASTTSSEMRCSTVRPYKIEFAPAELLPIIPPSVACEPVATSAPNIKPCGESAPFN